MEWNVLMQSGKCLDLDDKNISGYCLGICFFSLCQNANKIPILLKIGEARKRKAYAGVNFFVMVFKTLKHLQEQGIKKREP